MIRRVPLSIAMFLLLGCPAKVPPANSGNTGLAEPAATPGGSPGSTPSSARSDSPAGTIAATTERLTSPEGRLQAIDAYGNALFDATGKPIWEQTPREKASQLYEEAVAVRKGIAGQPPSPLAAGDRLREAVVAWPEFLDGWYMLASVQMEQNLLREARSSFQRVSEIAPNDARGWIGLGIVAEREEAWAPAQVAYERGLAIAPDNVDLLNGRVRILRARGQHAAAVQEALRIIAINSNSLDAYNSLGLAYMEQGEYELARFVFVKAKGSLPGGAESATLEANLGLMYLKQGKEFDAKTQFEKARAIDINHLGANVNLAYLELRNYDFEAAHTKLEQAHRMLPNNVPIQLNLAVARRGMGDLAGARQLLDPITSAPGPYQLDATYNLAVLQGDFLKDYKAALAGYNEYLNLRSQSGSPADVSDPVFGYIKEAERALKRQEQKKAKEAAAQQAPPPAPAPVPGPDPIQGGGTQDPGAPPSSGTPSGSSATPPPSESTPPPSGP